MAEQKVKLTELPTATDTLDTAQLLVNQNSTDQKLAITHLLRAKNNLSELEDFAQARANLDVPSVEEVNNKLSGFIDGSYTFIAGGSLASRSDFIWDEDTKSWYYWSGVLPKEVPAASNPDSTGGTGVGAWIPVGESVLRGDLAKPTGSSLIGYQYPADGSVPRTVEDKLGDFVSVLDFGAKGDGVTDDSVAFKKASATGKKVFIPDVSGNGSGCIYKVKNVYIKKPLLFGENIGVEIQPVSAGDEMFYFGDPDQPSTYIINGARIENLTFSCPSASDGEYPIAIRCHQQQQMEVFGCTFYRLTFELIDYRYVTFRKIRGIGSMFYSNRTQPNGVDWADALVISDSFIAYSSRVEVRNSVGFQMRNTYCANPTSTPCLLLGYDDWAKPSHGTCELTDVTIEGVTELNNCNLFVFIVNGHMGAFEGHGLTLKDCFSVNCVNTEFHYSKDFGVYMNACKKSSFTNTRFTNNGEGGIRIGGDTQYVAFAGCLFGEGGIANDGPTQKRGINIEDTSGGIAVLSSVFDGNSEVNIGGDQSKYRVDPVHDSV
ncbi:hypothetical protein N8Z01_19305 [Enterobacter hormaechei subsp. hoffmannii]|nr:hypothetical protein [Enterobacter hormaechei subsp. hoffmannii]MCU3684715.1 hypothetical protein [Enterobacter hormaechei subsp. hoffmannii]MCU3699015.1 hypothetical protein [Enterobacter hormaechei subsp. hoffmannii]